MIYKLKDPFRWQTGFALFGAYLEDGYFVLWRRFNFRMLGNGSQETCRYGTTKDYEAYLGWRDTQHFKPPPSR